MGVFLTDTGIDRLAGPRVRFVPRLVLALAALSLAGCGAATGTAPTSDAPTTTAAATTAQTSPHSLAEAELATLLAMVRVPSGAEQVASAPIAYLDQPPVSQSSPNLLTRTSFWRIDMSFADTLAWIKAHTPGGLTSGMGGQAGGPGVPTNQSLGFSAPSTTAYDGATIELDLAEVSPSMTGLRADAEVVWLPPKPSTEFIPADTAVTLVAINHFGSSDATTLRTRHLDSMDGAVVIKDVNALLPSDGGTMGCALDTGYRVQIETVVAGTPLVFSYWPACAQVQATRARTSLLTLFPSAAFGTEITHLMGSEPTP
jgi:hypothetical protein